MSLQTNLANLITTIGTFDKATRTMLNGNAADVSGLTTAASNLMAAINEIDAEVGDITGMGTTATTLASAINEVRATADAAAGGGVAINDAAENTTQTWSSSKIAGEIDADVAAAVSGLVDGAPGLIDTLNELAAALGDDPNFAATMTTALGNRVRTDTAAQGLNGTQQANAIANIGAISAAAIGDPETDLVAIFNAAIA